MVVHPVAATLVAAGAAVAVDFVRPPSARATSEATVVLVAPTTTTITITVLDPLFRPFRVCVR